jgi:hypothetical protein
MPHAKIIEILAIGFGEGREARKVFRRKAFATHPFEAEPGCTASRRTIPSEQCARLGEVFQ